MTTIKISLDGGVTCQAAPQGVRVYIDSVDIPGEPSNGEIHLNVTQEGVITDILTSQDGPLDTIVGTRSESLGDLVDDLVDANSPEVTNGPGQSAKVVKVVVDAHATSDYGDGPVFAEIEVDQALLDKLKSLSDLGKAYFLTEVHVPGSPNWGPGDIAAELRLQNEELVVVGTDFWFVDYPKHGNYSIESDNIAIASLRTAFESATDGEVVFLCEDGAQETYEEQQEERDVEASTAG